MPTSRLMVKKYADKLRNVYLSLLLKTPFYFETKINIGL